MKYLSVVEIAKKWNLSDRSVRNYCAQGKIPGAFLTDKTWNIPESGVKPDRTNKGKFRRKIYETFRWNLSQNTNCFNI